jgi:DNA primase
MPKSSRPPDRILFPGSGFTLAEAVEYYRRAAKWLLPQLTTIIVQRSTHCSLLIAGRVGPRSVVHIQDSELSVQD